MLNLYGSGAIPALDKNWGVQAASHVTTVSFKFIDFDQVSGRERSKISLYIDSAFVQESKKVTELLKQLVVWKPQSVSQRLLFRRSPLFYNTKYLDCIGALSFYDSKRSIGWASFVIDKFFEVFIKQDEKSMLHMKTKYFGQLAECIKEQRGETERDYFIIPLIWEWVRKVGVKKFLLSERNFWSLAAFLKRLVIVFCQLFFVKSF